MSQRVANRFGGMPTKVFGGVNGSIYLAREGNWNDKVEYELMIWKKLHLFRYHVTHIVAPCGIRRVLNNKGGRKAHGSKGQRASLRYKEAKYIKIYTEDDMIQFYKGYPHSVCADCFGFGKKKLPKAKRYMEEASDENIGKVKKLFLPFWDETNGN